MVGLFEKRLLPGHSSDVWVFSGSGKLLSVLKGVAKDAFFICFTLEEDLLIMDKTGSVSVFDLHSCPKETFSIDPEVREAGVLECQQLFTGATTGLALLTTSNKFFVMPDIKQPSRVQKLAAYPGSASQPPSSWTAMSGTESRVVVAVEKSVFLVTCTDCVSTTFDLSSNQYTQIHQMASSFCGSNLAFLTDTGILWFGSVDPSGLTKRSEFNTQSKSKAAQLLCAANAAVVGLWKDVLLAVGEDKTFFNLIVERPSLLVQEVDGLRIISNRSHEFLQQVPQVVSEIFQIGSIAPGSLLVEAKKEFDKKSHKADEYLRILRDRNDLESAVLLCI